MTDGRWKVGGTWWLVGCVATTAAATVLRQHTLRGRIIHYEQVDHLEREAEADGVVRMVARRLPAAAIEGYQIAVRMGADERRHLHFPANRNGTRTL